MRDKVLLITGGTGTFGKAFCRTALQNGARQVRIFSRDELKQAQMAAEFNDPRVEYLCGDIRDAERLLMALEGVDICVHAAAMKRIEKCERDPIECKKTNVDGTINVLLACLKNNVKSAILISTDKAAMPINTYGASKMLAEKEWINGNVYRGRNHPTRFSVVRYGNVLGSRGSVIHAFKNQAERGRIEVFDQRMTRFFITIQQAVDLVQLAIEEQQGGEIYLPRLKGASIYHIAKLMAGRGQIVLSSQRGSEKLHEVLSTPEECERTTNEEHYSIVHPYKPTWPYMMPKEFDRTNHVDSSTAEQFKDDELVALIGKVA